LLRVARALAAACALQALAGAAAPALAGGTADRPGPLPWRVAGILPITVDAATFPDSAGYALEVYVRISPAALSAAVPDSFGITRLKLLARLRNGANPKQHDREQLVTSMTQDSSSGFGKVVVFRFPARPGGQRLRVRIEDLNSRKRGIAYVGRTVKNGGEIEGDFSAPKPQMERDLSDLEFVWDETGAPLAGGFRHDTTAYLPNPERVFGLYASDLRCFFSARSPDERVWHWVARILDPSGHALLERDSSTDASRRLEAAARIDVSTLPAGGYDLEVKAWQEGDAGALLRRSHFSVAWHSETWTANPADIDDIVHLLLSADAEERFSQLEPGEREHFLDEYWKVRDPTPGTAENEALEEFFKRVDYANRTYTRTGLLKGMFTDMGRVYIRYGPPDEITHQVMPAGSETLSQALDEINATESRSADDVRRPGLGGDIRPFEVWVYEGVIPTPLTVDPRDKGGVRRRRLLFLFVDEQGMGQYTQRYSTE
jgi:GWxTD domain-containing protein